MKNWNWNEKFKTNWNVFFVLYNDANQGIKTCTLPGLSLRVINYNIILC